MRIQAVFVFVLSSLLACIATAQIKNPGAGGNGGGAGGAGNPATVGLGMGGGFQRRVPHGDYYLGFAPYNTGDYVTARNAFQHSATGALKSVNGNWVDSICYHTMIGECYYQMGDYVRSLDQHNAALRLYVAHQDWLLRVQWPANITQLNATKNPATWGISSRKVPFGNFPETIACFQGNANIQQVLVQGGVAQQPQLVSVDVMEILRCTTLSLRRRADLLGPVGPHDPFTRELLDVCSRKQTQANHWSQQILGVQLGMALIAAGKGTPAISELQNSLLAGGQFEHPHTSSALLELGKLMFASGQYENAATYFAEATFSAAVYSQGDIVAYDIIEEAFRWGLLTHLVVGSKNPYPPLLLAAAWSARLSAPLQASLLTMAAENLLALGETNAASQRLAQSRQVLGRHECALGAIGARLQYESAKLSFQTGNLPQGTVAVNAVTKYYQQGGSRRMFQIGLCDLLYSQNLMSERIADQLFTDLLREPQPADWAVEPSETLAVEMTPHQLSFEHWFELSLAREIARERREPDKALEIVERIRRHRFFTTQTLGGRLTSLRWLLESPKEALPERALLQRQDLLNKYPKYAEISREAAQPRQEIATHPLNATEDDNATKQQVARLEKLANLSGLQEVVIHDMALSRHAADAAFPPLLNFKEFQKRLKKGQLVLAFYNGSRYVVGFAITQEKYTSWNIEAPNKLRGDISEMLKKMGQSDRNKPLDNKDFKDDSWKSIARRILPVVTNSTPDEAWSQFEELIIVPDGPLWYLPFEALPIGENATGYTPLISKVRIRYAPTVALAVPDGRFVKSDMRTAAVAGKLFPKDTIEVSVGGIEDLSKVLPNVTRLMPKPIAPTSLLAKFYDRLVVYHDMDDLDRVSNPFEWSPVQIDKGKPGSGLGSWLPLPWGGPQQVTFPGFHTVAETGLRKTGSGDEVFLTLCGLMSTGTRTVLLSRWRTGGKVSYDLVREYLQELPHSTASAAWQRSVELRMKSELDLAQEPRVKLTQHEESLKAEHPFFWSGYLLVDTGAGQKREDVPVLPKINPNDTK